METNRFVFSMVFEIGPSATFSPFFSGLDASDIDGLRPNLCMQFALATYDQLTPITDPTKANHNHHRSVFRENTVWSPRLQNGSGEPLATT